MTNSIAFKEIGMLSRGSYEEYYNDLFSDVLKRFGEKYDPDAHDELQERLVITLLPRTLPTKPGSVIEYQGWRWMRLDNGDWACEDATQLMSRTITQLDQEWKQLL